jgi:hypothetical protein
MIDGTGLNVIAPVVSKLEDVRTLAAIRHASRWRHHWKGLYEQLLTLEEALEVSAC